VVKGDLLVAVDIDGTVADPSHRMHVLGERRGHIHHFDPVERELLRKFMAPELVANDTYQPNAVECVRRLRAHPRVCLAFITGRDSTLHDVTSMWLLKALFAEHMANNWAIVNFPLLAMRPHDDDRPSHIVKGEAAESLCLKYGLTPFCWFDDDPAMLDRAARTGFMPFAAPGCWADALMNVLLEIAIPERSKR
jgi:hypothetical protein